MSGIGIKVQIVLEDGQILERNGQLTLAAIEKICDLHLESLTSGKTFDLPDYLMDLYSRGLQSQLPQ